MKAVRFNTYGGPEVLQVVEVEAPHAGPGQVRIRVRAAGVNPIDWKIRAGLMREFMPRALPSGVGVEAAGVVDELGAGVADVAVGDPVFGAGIDTVAEHAVLTHWAHKPGHLSFEEAAGYAGVVETATRILAQVGARPGETLLVNGAAGGVGSAVVQFARHRGLTVIGTASAGKHGYLRSLGAVPTTYGPGLVDRVKALAPGGVQAALDLAGSGVIPELVALAGDASRVLSIADFTATRHGAQVSSRPQPHPEPFYAEAARLHGEGAFRMPVEQTFPLEETAQAHRVSEQRRVTGKLVITLA